MNIPRPEPCLVSSLPEVKLSQKAISSEHSASDLLIAKVYPVAELAVLLLAPPVSNKTWELEKICPQGPDYPHDLTNYYPPRPRTLQLYLSDSHLTAVPI